LQGNYSIASHFFTNFDNMKSTTLIVLGITTYIIGKIIQIMHVWHYASELKIFGIIIIISGIYKVTKEFK